MIFFNFLFLLICYGSLGDAKKEWVSCGDHGLNCSIEVVSCTDVNKFNKMFYRQMDNNYATPSSSKLELKLIPKKWDEDNTYLKKNLIYLQLKWSSTSSLNPPMAYIIRFGETMCKKNTCVLMQFANLKKSLAYNFSFDSNARKISEQVTNCSDDKEKIDLCNMVIPNVTRDAKLDVQVIPLPIKTIPPFPNPKSELQISRTPYPKEIYSLQAKANMAKKQIKVEIASFTDVRANLYYCPTVGPPCDFDKSTLKQMMKVTDSSVIFSNVSDSGTYFAALDPVGICSGKGGQARPCELIYTSLNVQCDGMNYGKDCSKTCDKCSSLGCNATGACHECKYFFYSKSSGCKQISFEFAIPIPAVLVAFIILTVLVVARKIKSRGELSDDVENISVTDSIGACSINLQSNDPPSNNSGHQDSSETPSFENNTTTCQSTSGPNPTENNTTTCQSISGKPTFENSSESRVSFENNSSAKIWVTNQCSVHSENGVDWRPHCTHITTV